MKRALVASLLAVLPLLVHAGRNNRSGVRDMPPKLRAWMRRQPADELRGLAPMARRALSRVLDPKVSELSQLWAEARSTQWTEAIADLERRLGP